MGNCTEQRFFDVFKPHSWCIEHNSIHQECGLKTSKFTILNVLFKILCDWFQFNPQVDLFATRLNKQINKYVSWMPDPYSIAVNAFNFIHKIYASPPFSLVGAAISKLIRDNTMGIMIIPEGTTQYWFPTILAHLIDHPIQLPSVLKTLSLPFKPSKAHPLSPKLQLLAVILSGNPLHRSSVFPEKLKKSSSQPGNLKLPQNTNLSLTDGNFFV